MRLRFFGFVSYLFFFHRILFADPYWNSEKVPKDKIDSFLQFEMSDIQNLKTVQNNLGIDVLRITVEWEIDEIYKISTAVIESSGTPALLARSTHKPPWGSFMGVLTDEQTGGFVFYDSVGTGSEYRKITRAMTFRFPAPKENMKFELFAENPKTGVMEKVIAQKIDVSQLQRATQIEDVEIKELHLASKTPSLRVNIYADGYLKDEKALFWQHAAKTVKVLQKENFPGLENMSFYAVFHSSDKKLGAPRKLQYPIPEYETFLGFFYAYWFDDGERWYNMVYPTREEKLRQGLATAPYDYPIVLNNNSDYWGIATYMAFVTIPAANNQNFTYLLAHEFGHLFGLNEEYDDGGTELLFAPEMTTPWSQNMSFSASNGYENLPWKSFVKPSTLVPTPDFMWQSEPPVYGAYSGGYGGSGYKRGHHSYKPGKGCVMGVFTPKFCDICKHAIEDVVQYGRGDI